MRVLDPFNMVLGLRRMAGSPLRPTPMRRPRRCCEPSDARDLMTDPRFLTVADRYRNASAWFALRSALEHKPTAIGEPTGSSRMSLPCHATRSTRWPAIRHLSRGPTDASGDRPCRRASHGRAFQRPDRRRGAQVGTPAKTVCWDTVEILEGPESLPTTSRSWSPRAHPRWPGQLSAIGHLNKDLWLPNGSTCCRFQGGYGAVDGGSNIRWSSR